jgi:molybdenum cofactor cytidylyltransferase
MTPIAIAGLVLAAGESRRMGKDKALLEYHGQPFLDVVLENLRKAYVTPVIVVLGHHAEEVQRASHLPSELVMINPDYRTGQTSSLQAGLRALDVPEIAGVLLCLVDHPAAGAAVMRQLVDAFAATSASVVIPVYQGQRGHPVLIGRNLFEELLALDPRKGANTVVRKYLDVTHFLEVEDPGVLLDIDEPGDYQALLKAGSADFQ